MGMYNILRGGVKVLMNEFKEPVTITHVSGETIGDYSEVTQTTSSTSTYGVVYDLRSEYAEYPFGELGIGDVAVLLGGAETISERDTITHDNVDYKVVRLDKLETKGGTVGYAAYCEKI